MPLVPYQNLITEQSPSHRNISGLGSWALQGIKEIADFAGWASNAKCSLRRFGFFWGENRRWKALQEFSEYIYLLRDFSFPLRSRLGLIIIFSRAMTSRFFLVFNGYNYWFFKINYSQIHRSGTPVHCPWLRPTENNGCNPIHALALTQYPAHSFMLNLLLFSIFPACPNPPDLQSAVNPFYYSLTCGFINQEGHWGDPGAQPRVGAAVGGSGSMVGTLCSWLNLWP